MVFTRAKQKEALAHILDNVFGEQPDSRLRKSLDNEGVEEISELITMSLTDIDALTYLDSKNITQMAKSVDKSRVKILQAYHRFRIDQGDPIDVDAYSMVSIKNLPVKKG